MGEAQPGLSAAKPGWHGDKHGRPSNQARSTRVSRSLNPGYAPDYRFGGSFDRMQSIATPVDPPSKNPLIELRYAASEIVP